MSMPFAVAFVILAIRDKTFALLSIFNNTDVVLFIRTQNFTASAPFAFFCAGEA